MSTQKKLTISFGWIGVSVVAVAIFPNLRHIGEQWTSNAGFLRLIGLSSFCLACVVAPTLLAFLAWIGQPQIFYKKLHR